jgi:uncharacterized protein YegL
MSVRRLPVYILADCSGSMGGDPIESVKQGIRTLHSNLMGDPSAVESAYLSVITFDHDARQLAPLTEVAAFQPPNLQASGPTSLGAALRVLLECIDREVRKTAAEQKGDWKPLIFLLTDGAPTDAWQASADEFKRRRVGNLIAVACGEQSDPTVLKSITETVLIMKDMSPDAFSQFFKWVSASVTQTSQKIGTAPGAAASGVSLPPPPPTITIIP